MYISLMTTHLCLGSILFTALLAFESYAQQDSVAILETEVPSQILQLSNGSAVVRKKEGILVWHNLNSLPQSIDMSFEISNVLNFNGVPLLVAVGGRGEAVLIDSEADRFRLLPSLGLNNQICCVAYHDGMCYFGYSPTGTVVKRIRNPGDAVEAKAETKILVCQLAALKDFVSGKELVTIALEPLPELNAFWLKKIVFIGGTRCYAVERSFIDLEDGVRRPKVETKMVNLKNGDIETIYSETRYE